MRVGDTYRIKRMVQDGHDDKEILARFKNDYVEEETKRFIKSAKDAIASEKKAEEKPEVEVKPKPKSNAKKDPLS
jgi:hypothetical protein